MQFFYEKKNTHPHTEQFLNTYSQPISVIIESKSAYESRNTVEVL